MNDIKSHSAIYQYIPLIFKTGRFTLIVGCIMSFSTIFQLYRGGQCTYPCFPGVLLTSAPHDILSKPLAAFQHNIIIVETTDSGERGMNPVAMTIINPWKEYWPGPGIEPATSCSQVLFATD